MLRAIQIILWLTVLVVGGFLIFSQWLNVPPNTPRTTGANVQPQSTAPKLAGVDYSTADFHIVNFFASWCVPCQVEHPFLVALNADFPVIGVAWKDEPKDTQRFITQFPDGFDQVLEDPSGNIGLEWRMKGLPTTYVVNAKGMIIYQRHGILLEQYSEEIRRLAR